MIADTGLPFLQKRPDFSFETSASTILSLQFIHGMGDSIRCHQAFNRPVWNVGARRRSVDDDMDSVRLGCAALAGANAAICAPPWRDAVARMNRI